MSHLLLYVSLFLVLSMSITYMGISDDNLARRVIFSVTALCSLMLGICVSWMFAS